MGFTSYQVDNDGKFKRYLKYASEVSDDLRVPFGLILRDFYRSEKAIFKLKGPGQYPDFKNERSRKAKKRIAGFEYPLLVRTGKLAASLLSPDSEGSVANITKLSLTFGTSVEYGIYHQSDEPRAILPLRKFLFIGPEASRFANSDQQGRLERWLNYLNDFIIQKVNA